jgi:5-methyltetrahydropteroyltriglutamate--homocysteine methyltransferase
VCGKRLPSDDVKRSDERILTTHTGSLPRSAALLPHLRSRKKGQPTDKVEFREAVTAAVGEVVRRQVGLGIDVVNDGEQGKPDYSTYIKHRLTGFEGEPVSLGPTRDQLDFPDYAAALPGLKGGRPSGPACTGRVAWKDFAAVERDIENLQAAVAATPAAETFMSAVSPAQAARFMPNRYYKSNDEYLTTLSQVLSAEYEAIVAAGFVLQLDCPDLASGWNNQYRHLSLPEFRRAIAVHIEVLNESVKNIPAERMRIHLCWGNYEGPHNHDIPLADIIDLVWKAKPAAVSFEGANPRHAHEWKVFRDIPLPEGRILIPGVIDSTTNFVEHPELVAERICNYAKLVGRQNVIAGTDCGFATSALDDMIFPSIAWAKLAALAEGARIASKALW